MQCTAAPGNPSRKKRCAYIELNLVHDEIQPMFWWLARQAGIEIDFYLQRSCLDRGVFCRVPDSVRTIVMDCENPHDPCRAPVGVEHQWTSESYDFLILGTAEPPDRVGKVAEVALPKLLVQHNLASAATRAPAGGTCCVLGTHFRDRLARAGSSTPPVAVFPFFLGEVAVEEKPRAMVFAVQGNLQFGRRNYASLVRAVSALMQEGYRPEDFVVRIVGRWKEDSLRQARRLDGEQFERLVEHRRIAEFFEFPDREYDFPEYFERMRSARYIIPLIDDVHPGARRYLDGKFTSSIGQGIGWLNIPVLHRTLASRLGIRFGYQYDSDDVLSGIRAALESGDDDDQLREVVRYRDDRLAESLAAFEQWTSRVLAA